MQSANNQATVELLKVAWIRDRNAPLGQPAKGRLNCRCGNAPESDFCSDNGDVHCACGMVYTWNGYIKKGYAL